VSQDRTLTNIGAKADVAYATTNHNLKAGASYAATPLHEIFTLGITDPDVRRTRSSATPD